MNKRDFLGQLAVGAGIIALPLAIEAAEQRASKPLTTAGLATSLLRLADKAEGQRMRVEAQAIYKAVEVVLKGTKAGVGPCDTDTDCKRRNGGDGGPGDD